MQALDEAGLAALAMALVRDEPLTPAARAAVALAGPDELGALLAGVRPPERRRRDGATWTPPALVAAMVAWAAECRPTPVRVVDCGAGPGRFAMAAARALPAAAVVAVEKDPLTALVLRAGLARAGLADRVEVRGEDFADTVLTPVDGPTVFLGNPPYVRHHGLTPEAKGRYADTMAAAGIRASRLAGLHAHFLARVWRLARPGDLGCLVTAAEWLDTTYGGALRRLLVERLGLVALDGIDPSVRVFDDAMATAVVIACAIGRPRPTVAVRWWTGLPPVLGTGAACPVATLASAPRWGGIVRAGPGGGATDGVGPPVRRLGALFRVSRGQVTGANGVWVVDRGAVDLPESVLVPAVTRGRELFDAAPELADGGRLRVVVDIPADYAQSLDAAGCRAVERFLAHARERGADRGYIARHRRPWFAVRLHPPAPILCTYMARRPPVFVVNTCGARHINIAHGLYPRTGGGGVDLTDPADRAHMADVAARLTATAAAVLAGEGGRTYAGGLAKWEPRDVEALPIDPPAGPHRSAPAPRW